MTDVSAGKFLVIGGCAGYDVSGAAALHPPDANSTLPALPELGPKLL